MNTRPATAYYRAVDDGRYDDLRDLLAPAFVHDRPDRTLDGRDSFVGFMRDERPRTRTSHAIDGVYTSEEGREVAVRGRLLDGDGEQLFGFVDVHTIEDDSIAHIETYTD